MNEQSKNAPAGVPSTGVPSAGAQGLPGKTEKTAITGLVRLVLTDHEGNVKVDTEVKNILTATGLAHMAARVSGTSAPAAMGWMGVGTGASAAVVANTLLATEIARVALSPAVSLVTTTQANDTIQYQATFGAGVGTGALVEAGVFGVVTANTGPMLNRLVFPVINKEALDSLTLTWKVKIA
jgi:hypothetical protein